MSENLIIVSQEDKAVRIILGKISHREKETFLFKIGDLDTNDSIDYWMSKDEAKQIIEHLQQQFGL